MNAQLIKYECINLELSTLSMFWAPQWLSSLPIVGLVVGEEVLEPLVDGAEWFPLLLEQEQNDSVLHQGPEHQEDADHQVEVNSVQAGGDRGLGPWVQ